MVASVVVAVGEVVVSSAEVVSDEDIAALGVVDLVEMVEVVETAAASTVSTSVSRDGVAVTVYAGQN